MSSNRVEKNAQALNQILRTDGKKLGKAWRQRIRQLLARTFDALNAKPLDGALCRELSDQIERELAAIESGEPLDEPPESPVLVPQNKRQSGESELNSLVECVPEALEGSSEDQVISPETGKCREGSGVLAKPIDAQGETSPLPKPADEIGLFDLIRVSIRCFFKIRACVRPPFIGKFVDFAEKFAEIRQERIDRFIGVLSKGDEDFVAKTEVEVGYREDLLPDMPERGLVLHPKKKRRN